MLKKPPVVVILGHVDHGKTTLLDFIRKTNIAEKEIGGITQKIGAWEIKVNEEKITFIDTPGHETFNNLRQRGAKIADMAIIVIAADDGVMPQTLESLEIVKNLKIPFIIAFNKIDKPNINLDKAIRELNERGFFLEGQGGNIPYTKISAKTGENVNELLSLIILLAEMHELKFDPTAPGEGFILESSKHPKVGYLATIIPANGKIISGDYLITSTTFCKIKFFVDQFNHQLTEVYPSTPALVGPFESLPLAGTNFKVCSKEEIEKVKKELEERETFFRKKIIFVQEATGDFNFIIKADNLGSLETIENLLLNLAQEMNKNIKIVKSDIGLPTFEDIRLAKQTSSFLVFFNLKIPKTSLQEINNLGLKYINHQIIYHLKEDIQRILEGKEIISSLKGSLEVLAIFSKTASKKTVGGKVLEGSFKINNRVVIKRNETSVGSGRIISIKKGNEAVKEVKSGELCGLQIETKTDILPGDLIIRE